MSPALLFVLLGLVLGIVVLPRVLREKRLDDSAFGRSDIRAALAGGVAELPPFMESLPTDEHAGRYLFTLACSHALTKKRGIDAWARREPESADAQLVLGACQLRRAWLARGYGRGFQVSRRKADNFETELQACDESLQRAARLSPDDPTPWAYLVMVATWRGESLESRWQCFEQAIARDPDNWAAHLHMTVALSEKWGGSHAAMFEFARERAGAAPEGSDVHMVLAKAHLERWKYHWMFDGDDDAAVLYARNQAVLAETITAYERSLASDQHEEKATTFLARVNAAAWFFVQNDHQRLVEQLEHLGGGLRDPHWIWAGLDGAVADAWRFARTGVVGPR
ncbi:MAG: hypothetical protein R3217_06835 [Gammaproteobacteria bacterium]|nr:hypothetical protein [Gammaproteobacteria bacterium]